MRIVVLIFHDESIYNSNDSSNVKWVLRGGAELFPKSRGRCLMVSGFICDCHGFLKVGNRKSYKIIAPGKNADGYWTNDATIWLSNSKKLFPCLKRFIPTASYISYSIIHKTIMLVGQTDYQLIS